jgi:phosphopentomutase
MNTDLSEQGEQDKQDKQGEQGGDSPGPDNPGGSLPDSPGGSLPGSPGPGGSAPDNPALSGSGLHLPTGRFCRVILIVLDSLGVGAMPDAADYGDAGSNTLGHILEACPDIRLPHLTSMGLLRTLDNSQAAAKTASNPALPPSPTPPPPPPPPPPIVSAFGRLPLASAGKDTITGHWEIAGHISTTPFQTFERFPRSFIVAFEAAIGIGTLGNCQASGTQIIEELGPEHERSGKPIVYTSLDSVFQIAANTEVIPLERLYAMCETARAMLRGPLLVGRVIARPYTVEKGERKRTSGRRDYVCPPPAPTLLNRVSAAGMEVVAIGKIEDIFSGQGITQAYHTEDNADGCAQTLRALRRMQAKGNHGLVFTNLVDFDSRYGHRRDVCGYARALEDFDAFLPQLLEALGPGDLLALTADHGNDPCFAGYNHTREYVPILYHGIPARESDAAAGIGVSLGTGETLADIGATIALALGIEPLGSGNPVSL